MDLLPYCINLSQPNEDLTILVEFAIKNLYAAGTISINNAGYFPAFPL